MNTNHQLKSIRRWTWFFMAMLALSGITASPIEWELNLVRDYIHYFSPLVQEWYHRIDKSIQLNRQHYPFVLYAFDWLAFAHLVIAGYMYGLILDPVRNQWLLKAAMISCLMVFPLAFVMGGFRGIPVWWRFIDCSFGAFGLIPLLIIQKKIIALEQTTVNEDKKLYRAIPISNS